MCGRMPACSALVMNHRRNEWKSTRERFSPGSLSSTPQPRLCVTNRFPTSYVALPAPAVGSRLCCHGVARGSHLRLSRRIKSYGSPLSTPGLAPGPKQRQLLSHHYRARPPAQSSKLSRQRRLRAVHRSRTALRGVNLNASGISRAYVWVRREVERWTVEVASRSSSRRSFSMPNPQRSVVLQAERRSLNRPPQLLLVFSL